MQQVFNTLALLAFMGVLLLAFAGSAMLRMLRDLQDGAAAAAPLYLGETQLPDLADPAGADRHVLVVEHGCPACQDRVAALVALPETVRHGVVVLGDRDEVRSWSRDGGPAVLVDLQIWNALAVTATPSLVRIDRMGSVLSRRVVGSDEELTAALSPAQTAG